MATAIRVILVFAALALGAMLDERSARAQPVPPPACDSYCRMRMHFYDCSAIQCLEYVTPDCFCCTWKTSLCVVQTSDPPYPNCTAGSTNTLVYYDLTASCTKSCTCAGWWVESLGNGNYSGPVGILSYKCTLT